LAHEALWAMQGAQAGRGIRLASQGQRAAGQLLPTLPLRLQAGALRRKSAAIHRCGRPAEKRGDRQARRRDRAWRSVLSEMEKCEVVCANCHRRRTAKRGEFLRAAIANG